MKVKLSELYDIGSSKRVFQSEWRDSGVPFYRAREIAKLSSDGFVDNELFIDEELYSEYIEKYGKPETGDVMVTGVGTLGVCYVVKPDDKFYFKDGNILWLKQKAKDKILPEYLVKTFDSKEVKDFIDKNSSGTTVGTFTIQTAKKMEISLPSLYEQREIIDKVTKIETIIKQRKQELRLLDDLVKARFVELFGDPEENPLGWDKVPLSEVIINANNGMARRGNDEDGNIVMRLVELQDGYIDYSNPNRIILKENEKKRYLLKDKDFLFARVNGNPDNVGRCAVFHDIGEDVYHNDHIIRVHFNDELLEGTFASALLNSDYGKRQLKSQIKTSAGQYTVSQDGIGAIVTILPSMDKQNQFAAFVTQVDKSKIVVQKELLETEVLFNALMQQYFGENR